MNLSNKANFFVNELVIPSQIVTMFILIPNPPNKFAIAPTNQAVTMLWLANT
jgi:hypothetical protein